MSSSYDRNIQRLKRTQEINLRQRRQNTQDRINNINKKVKEQTDNIGAATDLLVGKTFGSPDLASGEGGILPYRHVKHIEKSTAAGIEAEKQDRIDRQKRLQKELNEAEDEDVAAHIVKKNMLLQGHYYEDTDRYTKLNPHGQASYALRKIALWQQSMPDQLKVWARKNDQPFTVKGLKGEHRPKDVWANDLYPPAIKEALLMAGVKELRKQHGIDGFNPDLLELQGVNDYIDWETGELKFGTDSQAVEDEMGVVRKKWNVEQSNVDLEKHVAEFISNIPKGTASLNALWTKVSSLRTKEDQPMSGAETWTVIRDALVSHLLINPDFDLEDLDLLFEEIDPNTKLPYSHWKSHGKDLEKIKADYIDKKGEKLTSELDGLKLDSDEYRNKILKDLQTPTSELAQLVKQNGGKMTDSMVRDIFKVWQDKGGMNNGNLPEWLSDYVTKEEQNQIDLIQKAKEAYATRGWVTAYEMANLTPASIRELAQDINFDLNKVRAQQSGKLYHDDLLKDVLDPAIKAHFELEGDNRPWNYQEIVGKLTGEWNSLYKNYLEVEKHPPDKAAALATAELQYKLGLRPDAKGQTNPNQKEIDSYFVPTGWTKPESNAAFAKRVDDAKNKYDGFIREKETKNDPMRLYKSDTLLIKKDSKEFLDMVEYADTEGKKGEVPPLLISLASKYPEFSWEDLVNQQLIAGNHTGLKKYSAFHEAMSVADLNEFRRIIGYKAGPNEIVRGKIDAIDNSEVAVEEEPGERTDKTEEDWKNEAIEAAGPKPEPPPKPTQTGRGINQSYNKAYKKYEQELKEWESTVEALTPNVLGQGEPLVRERPVGSQRRGRRTVTEYYWNGEWSETPPSKDSYLQSYWNIPGSPVLNPLVAEYASELFNANTIT